MKNVKYCPRNMKKAHFNDDDSYKMSIALIKRV